MRLGGQTVGFVTVTPTGEPGRLGTQPVQRTVVNVSGCRHRPLDAKEAAEFMTNVATEIWKTTAPAHAAAIAAKSTGELIVDGVTYKILGGARPFTHANTDTVFKVTILSERQNA